MAKEDFILREEMGRLEIEPIKVVRSKNVENPFIINNKRSSVPKTLNSGQTSTCSCDKKNKINGVCKKKSDKILKEPVFRIIKTCVNNKTVAVSEKLNKNEPVTENVTVDVLNLCTLVKNCNQLKISSDINDKVSAKENNETKWWKSDIGQPKESDTRNHNQAGSSCSQQALNPPCDVTIDELASYFETLVHIPKKMSSMAEMMYI